MYEVSVVDRQFSIKNSYAYSLSIQVNLNGFSFSVLDIRKKNILVLKHYPFEEKAFDYNDLTNKVVACIQKDKILQRRYRRVASAFQTRKNTLIPKHYFKAENLKQLLEVNHVIDDLDELHYNRLPAIDGYNVFTLPNYLGNELISRYQKIGFYHHSTCMIHGATQSEKPGIENELYINVNSGFFDLLLLKKNNVYLYNTFEIHSADDLVYFVVTVFKQLNLNPDKTNIFYSGFISTGSVELQMIQKFLGDVKPFEPTGMYSFSKKYKKVPLHYFTNLFNLHVCVS